MSKIRTIDLFSGIGGFSYALRSACRTVAYCESDPDCRAVLRSLMRRRRLDSAPIFEDVADFPTSEVKELAPQLITAGFPCQDISTLGSGDRAGLRGARSGLFFKIPEIAGRLPSVKVVFLENSSNIVNNGWERGAKALAAAGFTRIAYGTFRTSDVGGLHKRARFYCLACRPSAGAVLQALTRLRAPYPGYSWASTQEPFERLVERTASTEQAMIKRCMMLGNSIVPLTTVHACTELGRVSVGYVPKREVVSKLHLGDRKHDFIHVVRYSNRGAVLHRGTEIRGPFREKIIDHPERITIYGKVKYVHRRWATPLHSPTSWAYQYRTLSYRGSKSLATQIYYEKDTWHPLLKNIPRSKWDDYCLINPRFIEFLMGYPKDWTRL